MSDDTTSTFGQFGRTYQEKVVHALIEDNQFAEQIADVLTPNYFELSYLQSIVQCFFDHKVKHKTFPSCDLIEIMLTRQDSGIEATQQRQIQEFLSVVKSTSLNGDRAYIEESSLEFCKKQSLKEGMIKALDLMESGKYDAIQSVIKDAMNKGATRDLGHEYSEGYEVRGRSNVRRPISTGWDVIDRSFNGGWERGTLSTFIAPTGAGKSMFLVNCGAASLAQGLNVAYLSLEMADWKIGLRFDSYFTGIPINDLAKEGPERVRNLAEPQVKGQLYIKEWPTKTATVQTIRAYLQRLIATKNFRPDVIIIDYADLLRGSKGYNDKRFELEGIYEELRALAQEFNVVLITADQTNRSGLDMEVVTVAQIGESYSKATVCDVIMTISRTQADKASNSGRIFIAKSRLGTDGIVFPFILDTATVKVRVLDQNQDPVAIFMDENGRRAKSLQERYAQMKKGTSGSEARASR